MKENITSKTKQLCERYLRDEISLQDFQFQLEPLLGSFDSMSIENIELVKTIINQLEIIIYTNLESSQKNKVRLIIPEILRYVEEKTTNTS